MFRISRGIVFIMQSLYRLYKMGNLFGRSSAPVEPYNREIDGVPLWYIYSVLCTQLIDLSDTHREFQSREDKYKYLVNYYRSIESAPLSIHMSHYMCLPEEKRAEIIALWHHCVESCIENIS